MTYKFELSGRCRADDIQKTSIGCLASEQITNHTQYKDVLITSTQKRLQDILRADVHEDKNDMRIRSSLFTFFGLSKLSKRKIETILHQVDEYRLSCENLPSRKRKAL